jgi:methyltransferase-like protein
MLTAQFDSAVAQTLEQISPNIIQLEQYMDFVRNRLFRQTLLCHKNLKLNRALTPAVMESLLVASEAKPDTATIDHSSETSIIFRLSNGVQVETAIPIVKAALLILYEHWPCAMSVTSLCNKALTLISETVPANAESCHCQLMQELFQLFVSNVIEVHSWQFPCVLVVSERPKVHPLAAYQAEISDWVVNMRHEHIPLDVFTKALIQLLDGSRDHAQLLDSMMQKAQSSMIQITINDEPFFE